MSDRTYVDLFEFQTEGDNTNVDIVTIEQVLLAVQPPHLFKN